MANSIQRHHGFIQFNFLDINVFYNVLCFYQCCKSSNGVCASTSAVVDPVSVFSICCEEIYR